jgi:site-specific DNA-methyltransferase (adenine-specific)
MKPYYEDSKAGIVIYHGRAEDVLPELGVFRAIITDPPYSERTHSGHDAVTYPIRGHGESADGADRKPLGYRFLSEQDCHTLAQTLHRSTDGWIVWMTDHSLFPAISKALELNGRYVFAPIPFVSPGSRVRLSGDGPSSWTDWICVARTAAQVRWGTLRGAYIAGRGKEWRDQSCIGGKPTTLMGLLIEDYAHCQGPICDPFMGHGTTLVAAKGLGVPAVGIDVEESACDAAARRLSQEVLQLA